MSKIRTHFATAEGVSVGCGTIEDLPGCSQMAVFHSAFVLPAFRNQGIGYEAHKDRIKKAEEALYDCAICTVDIKNEPQIANLTKAGWTNVWGFKSMKTGHQLSVWMKNL